MYTRYKRLECSRIFYIVRSFVHRYMFFIQPLQLSNDTFLEISKRIYLKGLSWAKLYIYQFFFLICSHLILFFQSSIRLALFFLAYPQKKRRSNFMQPSIVFYIGMQSLQLQPMLSNIRQDILTNHHSKTNIYMQNKKILLIIFKFYMLKYNFTFIFTFLIKKFKKIL